MPRQTNTGKWEDIELVDKLSEMLEESGFNKPAKSRLIPLTIISITKETPAATWTPRWQKRTLKTQSAKGEVNKCLTMTSLKQYQLTIRLKK